jgi:hypothetical protein
MHRTHDYVKWSFRGRSRGISPSCIQADSKPQPRNDHVGCISSLVPSRRLDDALGGDDHHDILAHERRASPRRAQVAAHTQHAHLAIAHRTERGDNCLVGK